MEAVEKSWNKNSAVLSIWCSRVDGLGLSKYKKRPLGCILATEFRLDEGIGESYVNKPKGRAQLERAFSFYIKHVPRSNLMRNLFGQANIL